MTSSASSTNLPDYPIKICDFDFRCVNSKRSEKYSNLGIYTINQPQEDSHFRRAFDSWYSNTAEVVEFLSTHLKYRGLDNVDPQKEEEYQEERDFIINVNCADNCHYYRSGTRLCLKSETFICDSPQPKCQSIFSYFIPSEGNEQFIFGQADTTSGLKSTAECLTIVAHEIFHAVTHFSCDLRYNDKGMSGALHESYSDIFAVLVNNRYRNDIDSWTWNIGDKCFGENMIRNLDTPRYMVPNTESMDCHDLAPIHNYAAFGIISAKYRGEYLFKNRTEILPVLFYRALQGFGRSGNIKNKINRSFQDSREAIKASALMFRDIEINNAINAAFDHVRIFPSTEQ